MHKSVKDIIAKKNAGKKISVVTSYDYTIASLCDKADVDVLLDPHLHDRNDYFKQRDSGLNEILCKVFNLSSSEF